MGKTAAGAVWLNADMLSPYDYWQFWRNTEDDDVGRFLKLFTILPLPEIARLAALGGSEINEAKKVLASEATALLHGRESAEKAAETAHQTFEQGLSAEGLPGFTLDLQTGVNILEANVAVGFATRAARPGGQFRAAPSRSMTSPSATSGWCCRAPSWARKARSSSPTARRSTC